MDEQSTTQFVYLAVRTIHKVRAHTFGSDRDEPDSLALDELQRLVDVGQLVDSHLSSVGFRQLLAGDDLKQQHQFQAVSKVLLDVLDLSSCLAQVRVAPCCERLQ